MIILDLNQVMIANIMTLYGKHLDSTPIELDLFRSIVLNTIRSLNKKFRVDYGNLVIASDGKRSWRKNIFPYYKANRKQNREESGIDWSSIFSCMNTIRDEIKENFQYPVLCVDGAEADDIIGVLVRSFCENENILILSGDKDFIQLHKNINGHHVKQFDPINKKYITAENPTIFKREHILKGDTGDGIPNFLSPDNSLVDKLRQKPILSKNLVQWVKYDTPQEFCSEEQLRNYKRNECLIDLDFTPQNICDNILSEYTNECNKPPTSIMDYMMKNRLKVLMESLNDF